MIKNFVRFADLFDYENKSKIKAGDGLQTGKYPFYTSSNELSKYLNEYSFDKTSLIFGTGGNASIHYTNVPFSVSTDCVVAIPMDESKICAKYVFYYLSGNINLLEEGFKGAGLKHISKAYINEIQIPLPPLATQKRIAEILDAADALRRKDQALLKKYDELAQAIFIDMFGDPVKNDKGWNISKLGDCCGIGSSVRVFVEELVAEGIPFLRGQEIGAMSAGEQIEPSLFITEGHYDRLKAQGGVPKIGDLLMPSICPDGRIFQVTTEAPFYFKDGRVLWVKVNENNFDSTFLKFLLKEKFLRNYTNIASGTTFAELKIFALKDLELIVPSMTLQKKFAELTNLTFDQLQLSRRESDNAKSLFNSLIQKAFNGELVS